MKGLENIYHKEVPGLYKNGELFLSFEELLKKDYVYVDKGVKKIRAKTHGLACAG